MGPNDPVIHVIVHQSATIVVYISGD